uniref:Rho-GAP domain-containing protein n=1 Tax=Glossina brevipalpis TaxID=37001 RepID=A0A1A9WWH2_9MUSC
MTTNSLSTLAAFDDIRRCTQVLCDGSAEEEFLKVLQLQEKFRLECVASAQEAGRLQRELDASLQSITDLESKLFYARRMLEMETKARKEAQQERDQMERKILAVADLLKHENNLKNETKDKLAFLHNLQKKRKSRNPHLEEMYGNEINSTGSFLSDLSITHSEDDFLESRPSRVWHKHRPSVSNAVPYVGNKRSRLSATDTKNTPSGGRKSKRRSRSQEPVANILRDTERFCATTKVTIPQDGQGAIRAESTIETVPVQVHQADVLGDIERADDEAPICASQKSVFRQATAPPTTPVTISTNSPMTRQQLSSTGTLKRAHNFARKTFIKPETCVNCQKKIRFNMVGFRCRDCPVRCHIDCRSNITVYCVPGTPTNKGLMGYLADYAPTVSPMIPALIVHCVNEIESRGLNEVGIYRLSGSEREVKALKERFLKNKTTPHLSNIDVHVLCGCIKDFLRSLNEPLIPTTLWKDFCNAIQNPSEENKFTDLTRAIDSLPQANRDTLAFLILHFQRVAESPKVLMPFENLARIFGPTIVGNSSSDPDQHAIFTEIYSQYAIIMNLLKVPTEHWVRYVTLETEKENSQNAANLLQTPKRPNKDAAYTMYATPFKPTLTKRRFFDTPPVKN